MVLSTELGLAFHDSARADGPPVLGFSRSEVWPGESARAVIIPLFPKVVPRWRAEVVPGVLLPMYEGGRVCGHGRVLWVEETTTPLPEEDETQYLRWLESPEADAPG